MTTANLYQELNNVNYSRAKRLYYTNILISNPSLVCNILDILFQVDNKMSSRAAWVLEFLCNKDIHYIIPHLDQFTANIKRVHIHSATRPVAKICELIAKAYTAKENHAIKKALSETHKQRIIENCFDYMINNVKVAPKAYGMTTLFMLGYEYDWVHHELVLILERDFALQSAAFKARAKHIFNKLKK